MIFSSTEAEIIRSQIGAQTAVNAVLIHKKFSRNVVWISFTEIRHSLKTEK